MNHVLFLCSGNYYRSRYAELVFNHWAERRQMAWRAVSRGFRLHPQNVGPISQHAVAALADLGITLSEPVRFPCVAQISDLAAARRIVAVKQDEHRPMVQQWFPDWIDRVEYWNIHDVDCARPEQTLPQLCDHVRQLLATLTRSDGPVHAGPPGQ